MLVGDALTVGVQADGAVVIAPQTELSVSVQSQIGGDFNRIARGDVFSMDDWGGFTANVHVPLGTGRQARLAAVGTLPFAGLPPDDLTTLGAAEPGWQVRADVSPGERLFLSAFPGRPYDWAQSFDFNWSIIGFGEAPEDYSTPPYVTDWFLFNVSERGWAQSYGPRYEPRTTFRTPTTCPACAPRATAGSPTSRSGSTSPETRETFADEIARWRDDYGMDGMYSDGLAQDDWLSAYELMRRLRGDVYPDGTLIIHDSFPQSGVAAAAFRPFIYTYATSTYMAENARVAAGAEWAWARYVTGQHGRAQAIGVTKGDGWTGFEGVEKYLVGLVWGGRGNPDVADYDAQYRPVVLALEALWQEYGDDPNFFDRVYHPEAQRLTGYAIGRAGMPVVQRAPSAGGETVTLFSWTDGAQIRWTADGSIPTEASPLYTGPFEVAAGTVVTARAFRPTLEPSLWASGAARCPFRATPRRGGARAPARRTEPVGRAAPEP